MLKLGKIVICREKELEDTLLLVAKGVDQCLKAQRSIMHNGIQDEFEWKKHSDDIYDIWGTLNDIAQSIGYPG